MQGKDVFIHFLKVTEQYTVLEEKQVAVEAQSWWWPIEVTVLCSLSTVWLLQRGSDFSVGGLADEMVLLAYAVQHFVLHSGE